MDINRANSKLIRADERQKVLAEFNIRKTEPLAVGTEAEVYEHDPATLLKIYADASRLPHLETLRKLYDSLDTTQSGLTLPQIQTIIPYENLVVVLETRLDGEPLENLLPNLQGSKLERAETLYLNTVWKLKDIEITQAPATYLLFDDARLSDTPQQNFETFYAAWLEKKVASVGQFFLTASPSFGGKAAALIEAIGNHNQVPLSLVHGDFFPGNVLVDKNLDQVQGIIDFGSFTLFGNYLLDIAGAFGFYKMYDPERQHIRERLLPIILQRLSLAERPVFFQFLLAHAILTSDLYASSPDPRHDDHFRWAAEIISEDHYWKEALCDLPAI